ncbi:ketopantoate reductase family protein [Bacillaceae bacterium S4-13-58]
MNIVVLGAGAVGGYFGGKLAYAGFPVTFLVREKRYNLLKKNGLQVYSKHGDFTVKPKLAMDPKEIEGPSVVLVALKTYHLDAALPTIESLVNKGAKVLPLLNGVDHLDKLSQLVGPENVLGGLCYVESTLNEEGAILQTSDMHDLFFGPLSGDEPQWLDQLESMMKDSGFVVQKTDRIIEEMWRKYIFLSSLSAITTAMRSPIGVAVNDPVTSEFLKQLIREGYQVARSKGIALPATLPEDVYKKMEGLPPKMTSSMHRDFDKGLPIELEELHGALVKMGNDSTPAMSAIYSVLHPFREGKK